MPSAPKSRKTIKISDSLNRQLNTYAQVASVAGVSVLALTRASEAKVVYTETHQVTHQGYPLNIDLNHDGINDFQIRTMFYVGSGLTEVGLNASAYRSTPNAVAGRRSSSSSYFFSAASALPAGARIGPNASFPIRFPLMAEEVFPRVGSGYSDLGPWAGKSSGVRDRYLGLKFFINGEVHYGWARLSVGLGHERLHDDVLGLLTGYAYETVPNKPIIAGQTKGPDVITVRSEDTLGGLALGRK